MAGSRFVTLFHLPRADLHSLAQLQHANLQPAGPGPGYTVGHSYADPHTPDGTADFNHRLNEALWDRFFFSTLPAETGALPAALPNRRIVYHRRDGVPPEPDAVRNYDTAAAHLLVDGPFNLNSTSVEAWQALLASFNGQRLAWDDPATGATTTITVGSAFLRGRVRATAARTTAGAAFARSPMRSCTVSPPRSWTGCGRTGRSARSRSSSTARSTRQRRASA